MSKQGVTLDAYFIADDADLTTLRRATAYALKKAFPNTNVTESIFLSSDKKYGSVQHTDECYEPTVSAITELRENGALEFIVGDKTAIRLNFTTDDGHRLTYDLLSGKIDTGEAPFSPQQSSIIYDNIKRCLTTESPKLRALVESSRKFRADWIKMALAEEKRKQGVA